MLEIKRLGIVVVVFLIHAIMAALVAAVHIYVLRQDQMDVTYSQCASSAMLIILAFWIARCLLKK